MLIQPVSVQKIVISELPGLDPVSVYLEDLEPGRGNLTVRCYDKSWTSYWGAMGKERPLLEFLLACDTPYLVNSLSRGISETQFSGDELVKMAKRSILERRRPSLVKKGTYLGNDSDLSMEEARDLYNQVGGLSEYSSLESLPSALMDEIFGEEWWHTAAAASEPNPSYLYLHRIVDGIKEGLKEYRASLLSPEPSPSRAPRPGR